MVLKPCLDNVQYLYPSPEEASSLRYQFPEEVETISYFPDKLVDLGEIDDQNVEISELKEGIFKVCSIANQNCGYYKVNKNGKYKLFLTTFNSNKNYKHSPDNKIDGFPKIALGNFFGEHNLQTDCYKDDGYMITVYNTETKYTARYAAEKGIFTLNSIYYPKQKKRVKITNEFVNHLDSGFDGKLGRGFENYTEQVDETSKDQAHQLFVGDSESFYDPTGELVKAFNLPLVFNVYEYEGKTISMDMRPLFNVKSDLTGISTAMADRLDLSINNITKTLKPFVIHHQDRTFTAFVYTY